jgi:hypothetical protein
MTRPATVLLLLTLVAGSVGDRNRILAAEDKPTSGKPAQGGKPGTDKVILPARPLLPARDAGPLTRAIDTEIDRRLAERKIPVSPPADDAEFLRRVTLDLTGRIPTYRRTVQFLESSDPDKRRRLIDELLASPAFAQHFATVWRNLLAPPDPVGNTKAKGNRDTFSPWLAEQFQRGRGWDRIVRDLLTAEGPLKDTPQNAFLMANADNFQPLPERVAGSAAALFWGLQLRCAECHNHPFTAWKQTDFWATAAFFGRLRFTGFKGPGVPSLVEVEPEKVRGTVGIEIGPLSGKAAGQFVEARFLQGATPPLPARGALRPDFAAWAASADNPWFARATANRVWAHFMRRGLIESLDDLESSEPSHPELLQKLARELIAGDFRLDHLARAICNSQAYQRSSRPLPGNEDDHESYSRMALVPLSPEALYDSLAVVMAVDKNAQWGKGKNTAKREGTPTWPARDEFARAFRSQGQTGSGVAMGLPQLLELLNGPLLNQGAPVVEKLAATNSDHAAGLTELYLTVLSRRPGAEEVRVLSAYLDRRKDARVGYRGVLWMLLNSGEFALNH